MCGIRAPSAAADSSGRPHTHCGMPPLPPLCCAEAAAVEEKSVEEQKAEDKPAEKVRTLLLLAVLLSAACCNVATALQRQVYGGLQRRLC